MKIEHNGPKALGAGVALALATWLATSLGACSSDTPAATVDSGPSCGSGSQLCGESCTPVARDPENCGACGKACAAGEVCSQGTCALGCGGGTTECGGVCADTNSDPTNCGACGTKCKGGEVCSQGQCTATCADTEQACGQSCVDTQTDRTNCGGCGAMCGDGEICVAGKCALSCQQGLTLCSAQVGDGGVNDASVDAADASSDGGLGVPYCANLQTDNANCGGCGVACGPGETCSAGACTTTCQPNETLCTPDGGAPYCATTDSDNKNCGGCGNTCPAGQTCSSGTCVTGSCAVANGMTWCFNPAACGQACDAVCKSLGLTLESDTTAWFNAQNTQQLCKNISEALGLGSAVNFSGYSYACLEDSYGTHAQGGGLNGTIYCSSSTTCPAAHVNVMDQGGVACGTTSRRSVCPCK